MSAGEASISLFRLFLMPLLHRPTEPPNEPRIFDAQGKEVAALAGPFREGAEMFLSCQVTGGK